MQNEFMILDLETGTKAHLGQKASPLHPENYVVAYGHAVGAQGEVQGEYYEHPGAAKNFLCIPENVTVLVMHNASFDMRWLLQHAHAQIMNYLKRGGRVFCTQYAEYLLSNQQHKFPALDDVAPKYGGTHKIDEVKRLWEAGWDTPKIPKSLLMEYLIGPSGDIENTRKVFMGQMQALSARGMLGAVYQRMEGLLYNVFCEHSGMYIDMQTARADAAKYEAREQELLAQIQASIGALEPGFVFNSNSDAHMSAFVFGGSVKYERRVPMLDEHGVQKRWNVDCYEVRAFAGPVQYIPIAECTPEQRKLATQYRNGKNKGTAKVFKVPVGEPRERTEDAVQSFAGLLQSKRIKESSTFLMRFTQKAKLQDGTCIISTAEEAIQWLLECKNTPQKARDFLSMVQELTKLQKNLGTYYIRTTYNPDGTIREQKGMLQYVGADSIIHHSLCTVSTVTTRLSCTNPNTQNLPRTGKKHNPVRDMFASRYGKDGCVVGIDYRALEVVVEACLSGDSNLTRMLLEDMDMHCFRLAFSLKEEYNAVLEKCKNEKHPDFVEYDELRTLQKPKVFAAQYGASAAGIAYNTGCSKADAQKFLANELALFPEKHKWQADMANTVRQGAKSFKEKRPDGSVGIFKKGWMHDPVGTCYEFRTYDKYVWNNGQRTLTQEFKGPQMANYVTQGFAAFLVQMISGRVIRFALRNPEFLQLWHAVNNEHDALYFDMHKSVVFSLVPKIERIMQDVQAQVKKLFGITLAVPFVVDSTAGPHRGALQALSALTFKENT